MGKSAPLLIWALVLALGAGAAMRAGGREPSQAALNPSASRQLAAAAELHAPLAFASPPGAEAQRRMRLAASLVWRPSPTEATTLARLEAEPTPLPISPASIGPPDGATKLLRAAMQGAVANGHPHAPPPLNALAALTDATAIGSLRRVEVPTAYGELEPQWFNEHRLTILQLGDSHTAADYFTGRVRERLQQVFGLGGETYLPPGRPHPGVRSALFESDVSDGWSYEALQRSEAHDRFYLSGFNAVAHRSGATLTLRARGGRAYDHVEVAFLKTPGGGRAQLEIDGQPGPEINLDGLADERARVAVNAVEVGAPGGFREIKVKALDEGAVTVTGVDVARQGDGVSYISLGFPGATVDLLQKLNLSNIADDFRRIEPDVVVLAFGTNEGFNDNLDLGVYIRGYEQIVRKLMVLRPGLRVVIVGPPDAARPNGVCHAAGVGQSCGASVAVSAEAGGGLCRLPVPPKLNPVREAQRKLAERIGAYFWDWSSAMPGPCGAQIWAAATPPLMAHDYVHMTLEGYKQSADRFADFLIPLIQGRQPGAHVVSND